MTVAQTIFEQLGARGFRVMTGAHHLVGGENRLTMTLPNASYRGQRVTGVWITLTPMDVYTVEAVAFSFAHPTHKVLAIRENVYAEDLPRVFRELTGLETRVPNIRRA